MNALILEVAHDKINSTIFFKIPTPYQILSWNWKYQDEKGFQRQFRYSNDKFKKFSFVRKYLYFILIWEVIF